MANSIAKLAILLTTDTSGMVRGFQQAKAQARQFASQFNSIGGASKGIVGAAGGGGGGGMMGIGGAAVGIAALTTVLTGFYKSLRFGSELASQAEQAGVAFRVMLGSAEDAKVVLSDIRDLALATPFDQAGLQQNAQTLLQFGMAGEKVVPTLAMLGDVALGDAEKLQRLTLAFAQSQAAGRLMGQDLLQMINAGFNPLQTISEATGISVGELRKQMEAGAISAQHVEAAFKLATQEGGRFHQLNKEMLGTMSGQWARLKENFGAIVRPTGELINGGLARLFEVLNEGSDAMFRFRDWLHGTPPAAKKAAAEIVNVAEAFKTLKKATEDYQPWKTGWGTEGFAGSLERFNKLQDDLGKRGQEFAEKFRTPAQEFAAAVVTAAELMRDNAISAEVFARSTGKAKKDFLDAEQSAERLRKAMQYQAVGAAARGSGDAFSEVLKAQQQQRVDDEIQRRQLEEEKKANALLDKLIKAVEKNEQVRINEVDF